MSAGTVRAAVRMAAAALAATLLAAGVSHADEPRVRLVLQDGAAVEGTLVEFEARRYVVVLPDGRRRVVAERDVRQVDFLEPGAGSGPAAVFSRLGRALQGEGALAARVLEERHYLLREDRFVVTDLGDGTLRPLRVEALLRVRARRQGGGLAWSLEAIPREPGTALVSFGLGPLPARVDVALGPRGRPRAVAVTSRGVTVDLRDAAPPAGEALLPSPMAPFLLAALHDQGLPEVTSLSLLDADGRGPLAARLELRPAPARGLRRQLVLAPAAPDPQRARLLLEVGLHGRDAGRLLGWSGRRSDPTVQGLREGGLEVEAEAIGAEDFAARCAEWRATAGVARRPLRHAGGSIAALARAALAAGAPEGGWFAAAPGSRGPAVGRVEVGRAPAGLVLAVTVQGPYPLDASRVEVLLSPRVGLAWLRIQPLGGRGLWAELTQGPGGVLSGVAWRGWPQERARTPVVLPGQSLPRSVVRFALPLLGATGEGERLVLEEPTLTSPFGPELRVAAPGPAPTAFDPAQLQVALEGLRSAAPGGRSEAERAVQELLAALPERPAGARLTPADRAAHPRYQLRVVSGAAGWTAYAWSLEEEERCFAVGPDGVVRRATDAFAPLDDGGLPEVFRPLR